MPTLREYLNRTLPPLEERIARMSPEDRKAFEAEASERAMLVLADHVMSNGRL